MLRLAARHLAGVHLHFCEYLETNSDEPGRWAEQSGCVLNRILCLSDAALRLARTCKSLAKRDTRLEHVGMRLAVRVRLKGAPHRLITGFDG